jgi:hypothetical protein
LKRFIAIIAMIDDVENEEDDDWKKQLIYLEELDKLEQSVFQIPDSLRFKFEELIKKYPIAQKITFYRTIESLNWEEENLKKIYNLFFALSVELVEKLLDLINGFISINLHTLTLHVLYSLKPDKVKEIVYDISLSDIHYLFQIARFLSIIDITLMVDLINISSAKELINMIKYCNEPLAKHCRLCRIKKLQALEQRMLHNQLPSQQNHPENKNKKNDKLLLIPGTLQLHDSSQVWIVDDAKGFSFEIEEGLIFFNKEVVDLVRICDVCLLDVQQAITNNGRFFKLIN